MKNDLEKAILKLNINDMRIMYEHSITGELFK